jgi:hypothetical protein
MSGYDLAEWAAFEKSFGPIVPHERIDAAQAMASSVNARLHRAKGDLRATKFLPQWDGEQPGQTADEMVEALRRMARKNKAKKERHGN